MTKILSICALFLLASCARSPDGAPPVDAETKRYNIGSYWVREFRLDDGTRCVAMADTGIDCEWSQKVEL